MIQNTSNLPQDLLEGLLSDHHEFKVNVYQSDNQYTVEAEFLVIKKNIFQLP